MSRGSTKRSSIACSICRRCARPRRVTQPAHSVVGDGDRNLRHYDLEGSDDAVDDPLVFLAQPDSLIITKTFAAEKHLAIARQPHSAAEHGWRSGVYRSRHHSNTWRWCADGAASFCLPAVGGAERGGGPGDSCRRRAHRIGRFLVERFNAHLISGWTGVCVCVCVCVCVVAARKRLGEYRWWCCSCNFALFLGLTMVHDDMIFWCWLKGGDGDVMATIWYVNVVATANAVVVVVEVAGGPSAWPSRDPERDPQQGQRMSTTRLGCA